MSVPATRLRVLTDAPPAPRGRYVLYWMVAARRTRWNFALDRAREWAEELGKPLLIFEPLGVGYPFACDRFHRFLLDGMADNQAACRAAGVAYYPYAEPEPGAGRGLLAALAESAAAVVTDDTPAFFYPALRRAAAPQVTVRFEAVDGNGLLPLGATDRAFPTAHSFRRFLQKALGEHLLLPAAEPLAAAPGRARLPAGVTRRWPHASAGLLAGDPLALAALPLDHSVPPGPLRGGAVAAQERLDAFVTERLDRYGEDRNHPDRDGTSGLSPYLHFGHGGAHQVFARVAAAEGWDESHLARSTAGSRTGWWGASAAAEAFWDQLVTWREVGFNGLAHGRRWDRYESLPPWARATLGAHAADPRPYTYSRAELEAAATHDPLWNAAQRQLVREGRLHNYLRMLWGKKVLEWSASPREALATLLYLNDRYALDGRDPNSLSGIFWCLGRYDRAWGPERPIFGKIRYLSSANTARKVRVREYLERYGPDG